ncbi:MAG: hypothetical protein IKN69_03535 [Bacilli bacterium]|nr:hypothetical protein [Bacilli bacterium]
MVFLENSEIRNHMTLEAILSLPKAPLISRGKQGKKNEDRLDFIYALGNLGVILRRASFPTGFDPKKTYDSFDEREYLENLNIYGAYYLSSKTDSSILDAGLANKNIQKVSDALKKEAFDLIKKEGEDEVRHYAFVERKLMDTPMIRNAFEIALEAHKNEHDASGMCYMYHIIRVALACATEYEIITALLHDAIEGHDGRYRVEKLSIYGFPREVLGALLHLDHDKITPYIAYTYEAARNEIARAVKHAELLDNLDESRNHGKHRKRALYYFKGLSLIEKYPYFDDTSTLYLYDLKNNCFLKKTKEGHFILKEGTFRPCRYKVNLDDVVDVSFYSDDECLLGDNMPFFEDGVLKIE